MKLALALGSSAAALDEFAAAQALLAQHGLNPVVICINDAIRFCPVKPDVFVSVYTMKHPERFLDGVDVEGIDFYVRRCRPGFPARIVEPRWPAGTSGLYAVQIALDDLGCDGVVLAGCPIDASAGTRSPLSLMTDPERVERYRPEWLRALPEIASRTRSMSGWTRALLGPPDAAWFASLANPAADEPRGILTP